MSKYIVNITFLCEPSEMAERVEYLGELLESCNSEGALPAQWQLMHVTRTLTGDPEVDFGEGALEEEMVSLPLQLTFADDASRREYLSEGIARLFGPYQQRYGAKALAMVSIMEILKSGAGER